MSIIEPGSIVRVYDFKDNEDFYVEGPLDGFYYDSEGKQYYCIEVQTDTTQENRDMVITPVDLDIGDWPGRVIVTGIEEDLLAD